MYEYVQANEYQPVRKKLEDFIHSVQDVLRPVLTFQYHLIGSGNRHLITRIKGGNKGFDFDYNLVLQKIKTSESFGPEDIKNLFMNAFRKVLKETEYEDPQDSTSVITIRVIDEENRKILHSCDFAIVYYPEDDDSNYYRYLYHNKRTGNYSWEIRNYSQFSDDSIDWINENNYSDELVNEYLKLKNTNNDPEKHSRSLFHEAVNNVFNRYYHDDDEDPFDD